MPYPYDDESDDSYSYGLTEEQIRAKLDYAINGDELEDDYELDFGDLDDDEQPDDDDE
jgi:hypothetical protein